MFLFLFIVYNIKHRGLIKTSTADGINQKASAYFIQNVVVLLVLNYKNDSSHKRSYNVHNMNMFSEFNSSIKFTSMCCKKYYKYHQNNVFNTKKSKVLVPWMVVDH